MYGQPTKPHAGRTRPVFDRGLAGLAAGALLLIVVALIAVPLAARRTPALAPAASPEGVVQRFYQAAYAGDYTAAYAFLSAETQRGLSLIELQQQLSASLQHSQVRAAASRLAGAQATVQVTLTHFGSDGIFGSSEWQEQREVLLAREGEEWKIVSGPFFVPSAK